METLVSGEHRARKEKRERLVLKVKREIWEQKETGEFLAHLVSKVLKDHKDLKGLKDHLENLDRLDLLVKKEKMDHLDLLDTLVDQGIRETKVPKVEMDHLVLKEKEAKMVSREKEDKLVLEDSEVELEDLEALESLDPRERLEFLDQKVLGVHLVRLDYQEYLARTKLLDLLEKEDRLENMVLLDQLVFQE